MGLSLRPQSRAVDRAVLARSGRPSPEPVTALGCVASSAAVLRALGRPLRSWPRAERLRAADRDDFVAARQLVVACARRLSGRSWDLAHLEQTCPTCGATDHGRPTLPGLHVSWAHSAGVVAAVVSADAPIAIDVQQLGDADRVREVLVGAAPGTEPVQDWVVREALVKLGATTLAEVLGLAPAQLHLLGENRWRVLRPTEPSVCVAVAAQGPAAGRTLERLRLVDVADLYRTGADHEGDVRVRAATA